MNFFFHKMEAKSMMSWKATGYQIRSQLLPTKMNVPHRLQAGHFTFAYLLQFSGEW